VNIDILLIREKSQLEPMKHQPLKPTFLISDEKGNFLSGSTMDGGRHKTPIDSIAA